LAQGWLLFENSQELKTILPDLHCIRFSSGFALGKPILFRSMSITLKPLGERNVAESVGSDRGEIVQGSLQGFDHEFQQVQSMNSRHNMSGIGALLPPRFHKSSLLKLPTANFGLM
jgi:hypothetical protein